MKHSLTHLFLVMLFLGSCTSTEFDNPIDPHGENLPSAPQAPDLEPVNGKRAVLIKFEHNWEETDGVQVNRRIMEDSNWVVVDTVKSGHEIIDSIDLDYETGYQYRLIAINENGLSDPSDVSEVMTTSVPGFNLRATPVDGQRVVILNFAYDYTQGDTLWIERSAPGDEYDLTVEKLSRGELTFTDTMGLLFGDTLVYRVGGYRGKQGLMWGESKQVVVSAAPDFALRLTATANQRSMLLNFAYDYSQGDMLVVERDTSKQFKNPKIIDTLAFGSAYEDTLSLRYGKRYWWRLKGYRRDSIWEYSIPDSLSVAPVPDYGLQAASIPDKREIRLTFAYPYGKAGNLLVQRAKQAKVVSWVTMDTLESGAYFRDTSVAWDSLYLYRLSGYIGADGRAPSSSELVQVSGSPDFGLQLAEVPGERKVRLTFSYDYEKGGALYVERKRQSQSQWTALDTFPASDVVSNYVDTMVYWDSTYQYRLKGFEGPDGLRIGAVREIKVSSSPSFNLQASPVPDQARIKLTFAYDYGKGGALKLQRALASVPENWTTLATLQSGVAFLDESVEYSTQYLYRLQGYNAYSVLQNGDAVAVTSSGPPDYIAPEITMVFPSANLQIVTADTLVIFKVADPSGVDSAYVVWNNKKIMASYDPLVQEWRAAIPMQGLEVNRDYLVVARDGSTAQNRGTVAQTLQYIPTYNDHDAPEFTMNFVSDYLIEDGVYYVQTKNPEFNGTWSDASGLGYIHLTQASTIMNTETEWSAVVSIMDEGIINYLRLEIQDGSYNKSTVSHIKAVVWSPTAFDRSGPGNYSMEFPKDTALDTTITLRISVSDPNGISSLSANGKNAAYNALDGVWEVPNFNLNHDTSGGVISDTTMVHIVAIDNSYWKNQSFKDAKIVWKYVVGQNDKTKPQLYLEDGGYEWLKAPTELVVRDSAKSTIHPIIRGTLFDDSGIETFTINGSPVVVDGKSGKWSYTASLSEFRTGFTLAYTDKSPNHNVGKDTLTLYYDYLNARPTGLKATTDVDAKTVTLNWDAGVGRSSEVDWTGKYLVWIAQGSSLDTATVDPDTVTTLNYVIQNPNGVHFTAAVAPLDSLSGAERIRIAHTEMLITDIRDARSYRTVRIGTQIWMAENLAYLPTVSITSDYSSTEAKYYVHGYYGTDVASAKATSNYITYGVLYNGIAAMAGFASSLANPSGVQGICPDGWHLPSIAEWSTLENYVGGSSTAGQELKATTGWASYSGISNLDNYGFSALAGCSYHQGSFCDNRYHGYWWTTTEYDASRAYFQSMFYGDASVTLLMDNKSYAFSVRCVQN